MGKNNQNLKSALAKIQGGVKWELLEEGIEIEVDVEMFKSLMGKNYAPNRAYFEIEAGDDVVSIRKKYEKGNKVRFVVKFSN
jgi:hypothetical protein